MKKIKTNHVLTCVAIIYTGFYGFELYMRYMF